MCLRMMLYYALYVCDCYNVCVCVCERERERFICLSVFSTFSIIYVYTIHIITYYGKVKYSK